MKTLGLLSMVFAIAIAAAIAGHVAHKKQSGMFPASNAVTGPRQGERAAGPQASQNGSAPFKNGETGTMPEAGTPFGGGSMVSLAGCLVRRSGQWVLDQQETNREYRLSGELANLQPNEGRWVELGGNPKEEMPQGDRQTFPADFVVQKLQQVGPGCQPNLPRTVAVPGESGNKGAAVPITTTDSLNQPTSGTVTSTGRQQAPGAHAGPADQQTPPVKQRSMIQGAPPNSQGAGETPFSAERASQAVHRAHAAANAATGESSGQQSQTQSGQTQTQNNQNQKK
jgi:hypothetical protein